jgi:hypothetical protein
MAGFTIPAYHPVMDGVVNTAPITPASSETMIAIASLNALFNVTENILLFYVAFV